MILIVANNQVKPEVPFFTKLLLKSTPVIPLLPDTIFIFIEEMIEF
jgi:hypothetical protein